MPRSLVLLAALAACAANPESRSVEPANRTYVTLQQALRPLLGRSCSLTPKDSLWVIGFREDGPPRDYKFDMLGEDFVSLANPSNHHYLPFSAICAITTD